MSQTILEFLTKLRHLVEEEANTQYKQLERQWSAPLAERVAKGWAIEGLRTVNFQKQIIRLSCDTNDSRFREVRRRITSCLSNARSKLWAKYPTTMVHEICVRFLDGGTFPPDLTRWSDDPFSMLVAWLATFIR